MKRSNTFLAAVFAFAYLLSAGSVVQAQGLSGYPELAAQNRQQPVFFDFIILPGDSDSTVTFSSVFSFKYNYLPFRRTDEPLQKGEFISAASMSMEVFNSTEETLKKDNVSIEGLEPAERAFWSDTAFAKSYEQTKSTREFLSGHLDVSLNPGVYSYVLQMNRLDGTESRISRVQSLRIEPFSKIKTGDVLFGQQVIKEEQPPLFKLTDLGNNVIFGNDFYALAYIPDLKKDASYTLQIQNISEADKETQKPVYSAELTKDEIRTEIIPRFADKEANGNVLSLHSSNDGYAFALVKIPGSTFPNARYRLMISENETDQVVSQATFQTLWIGMPTSLLSLEVAIDMLRFIVNDETLDKISEGSRAEREKEFREFWEQQDPTPNTVFNELMAEYYRRIDYAYENFSSRTLPGYESDQGKIYIKFGAPQNVERKFPSDGATREIWEYPNRRFIFKATSGFGDFKLISS